MYISGFLKHNCEGKNSTTNLKLFEKLRSSTLKEDKNVRGKSKGSCFTHSLRDVKRRSTTREREQLYMSPVAERIWLLQASCCEQYGSIFMHAGVSLRTGRRPFWSLQRLFWPVQIVSSSIFILPTNFVNLFICYHHYPAIVLSPVMSNGIRIGGTSCTMKRVFLLVIGPLQRATLAKRLHKEPQQNESNVIEMEKKRKLDSRSITDFFSKKSKGIIV